MKRECGRVEEEEAEEADRNEESRDPKRAKRRHDTPKKAEKDVFRVKLSSMVIHKDYLRESARLKTFEDNNWPEENDFVDPKSLARCGMVYTGSADVAICAFCGAGVGDWEAGDVAEDEHRKAKPTCAFLEGVVVGNVTIEEESMINAMREQIPKEIVLKGDMFHAPPGVEVTFKILVEFLVRATEDKVPCRYKPPGEGVVRAGLIYVFRSFENIDFTESEAPRDWSEDGLDFRHVETMTILHDDGRSVLTKKYKSSSKGLRRKVISWTERGEEDRERSKLFVIHYYGGNEERLEESAPPAGIIKLVGHITPWKATV